MRKLNSEVAGQASLLAVVGRMNFRSIYTGDFWE